MSMLSPLMQKRLRSFMRIRRAWYSLIALGGVYLFCHLAPFFCQSPTKVIDTAALEKYREPVIENVYDIGYARYNVRPDGTVFDYEGPTNGVFAALVAAKGDPAGLTDYVAQKTVHEQYTHYFLTTRAAPAATPVDRGTPEISFPFRPCREHVFGVDAGGRDVYARVVCGMRTALDFGLLLALTGMFLGLVIGAVEGYFGGWVDIGCQRFTEIWSSIPFLYVMIFIGSTVGRSFGVLFFCYAIFNWIAVSYYMRAEFLRLRSRTFVEAAKCQGFSAARIIFGHILPNALTPLITLFPFLLMGAIGSLAALDFLGFGLPPMEPSCGELMRQAQQFRWAWWLILFPALALFVVMLLTVLVGEGLRDAFDPRQKSRLE